jgi:hypothetical protein
VPLLAAVLGAIAAGAFKIIGDRNDRKREDESILVALASEVKAICDLLRLQKDDEELERIIDWLKRNPDHSMSYVVDFKSDYFTVYHSLADRLGRLPPPATSAIVRFYSNCKTIIDCTRPEGVAAQLRSNSETLENLELAKALLRQTLSLGDEIVQMPKQPLARLPET